MSSVIVSQEQIVGWPPRRTIEWMTGANGTWQPMDLVQAAQLHSDAPFRWWVTGGHALELYLGARGGRMPTSTSASSV